MLRKRLSPEERRGQIVDAASLIAVEQGFWPLPLDDLARRVGVSKALVYRYFPTQTELINALWARHEAVIVKLIPEIPAFGADLKAMSTHCAQTYFAQVSEAGPILHILMSDHYCAERLNLEARSLQCRLAFRLARVVRRALGLPAPDCLAIVELFCAIVEEAASLVFRGAGEVDLCRRTCHQVMDGALDGLFAMIADASPDGSAH